jgi:uncharacterized protein YfdQ (DUF2303 family)
LLLTARNDTKAVALPSEWRHDESSPFVMSKRKYIK